MTQVPDLISRASVKAGGDKQLAELLDVPAPAVSMWKRQTRPCPPEEQARIAEIAGLDPLQALLVAHIERHAGTTKGDALQKVLGAWLPKGYAIAAPKNENAPESLQGRINWRKRKFSPRINHNKPGKRRVFSCHVSELLLGFVTR